MLFRQRQIIALFTLLMMLGNGLFGAWSASMAMAQAKSFENEDIVMICTGRDMKWVSMDASWQAGHFVFVDPPANTPKRFKHVQCSFGYLDDHKADLPVFDGLAMTHSNALTPQQQAQQAELAARYAKAQSRAPPLNYSV
ncbi:hypothetical protein P2G88_11520 [Aliiglaciecola sp. CAU 1673]|uniref:hypothetical protein n=1 Tax=Aliiglaciecola sp. CAU 1673 TaxID=3032595 RepID=UPI0023DC6FE2|nr:hypothetical protein [Aliiglaciecola sp. CAU 1673]MDF2178878.1 hypothetical protein [Aliiglaciecola sp. CAU 1673]